MATPDDAVNLAFKLPGQVLDVPVSQGAGVKKGELLAELDPRDIELQVAADPLGLRGDPLAACSACSGCWSTRRCRGRRPKAAADALSRRPSSTYENTLDLLKDTQL